MCTISIKDVSKTIKQHGVFKETNEALQSEVKHKMQRIITFTTKELLKRYLWKKKTYTVTTFIVPLRKSSKTSKNNNTKEIGSQKKYYDQ